MRGQSGRRVKAKFTGHPHHAYMSIMALLALQEVLDHLSIETRKHSETVPRANDVVSFEMAEIINVADEAVRHLDAVGLPFVKANRFLTEALKNPEELEPTDLDDYAEFLVQMKRSLRDLARPLFRDRKGNFLFALLAEDLRSRQSSQAADRQLARRQAKRIDESGAACEAQRVRFLALTEQVVALMETKVAGNKSFDLSLKKAIGRRSVERYPVINEYLAK